MPGPSLLVLQQAVLFLFDGGLVCESLFQLLALQINLPLPLLGQPPVPKSKGD